MQLENTVKRLSEEVLNGYQNEKFCSRNTEILHKHSNNLNEGSNLPLTITLDGVIESTYASKANLFNKFFKSVLFSKETYELEDVKKTNMLS